MKGPMTQYKSPLTEQRKQDENAFVIGEDDDDQAPANPTTDHDGPSEANNESPKGVDSEGSTLIQPELGEATFPAVPKKYWLAKGDTLHGIALRFKVNARDICKLNNLPPSTLSTTPHLLHTRSFIILPPTDRQPPPPPPDTEEREERRKQERAAKQFQFVTKEVDWGVAKTYVALVDDPDSSAAYGMKCKEMGRPDSGSNRPGMAIDQYLDDLEWEREQLKAGVSPKISPFPFFTSKAS
ncbi:hypothetical protein CPB86DRAFT_786067 [Serendipita vermifera]|nr:hypothetical protein CPB86DRAFT_786067 [Serendipita vermifera]